MSQKKMDLYGVMGDPISHSYSPNIHHLFALQTNQNISYELFLVPPDDLENAIKSFQIKGGRGLNITLPHKTTVLNYLDEISERARIAGAVNTLLFEEGRIYGDNTDGVGLMNDLEKNYNLKLKGLNILILGAGGATRGILQPLLKANPLSLTVANRTLQKATALMEHFNSIGKISTCHFEDISDDITYELIINATSAGTKGQSNFFPINNINKNTFCYDLSYSTKPTPFKKWSIEKGVRHSVDGWGMLIEQAAESFYLWRGIRPDTNGILTKLLTHSH